MTFPSDGDPSPPPLRLGRLAAPVLERLPRILLLSILAALVSVGVVYVRKQRYEAGLTVATVGTSRPTSPTAGFAAALFSSFNTGLQATPALIVKLAESRAVLDGIAHERPPGRGGASVVELVDGDLTLRDLDDEHYKAMRRIVHLSIDRETGLVSISVVHPDSALGRYVATRIVGAVTKAFGDAMHAQATELRVSQGQRVDSAARQLRRAEELRADFLRENRSISEYSLAALTLDRLNRDVTLAQQIYSQAVGDREAAVGKELEETPAVVVVEGLPPQLPRAPRFTVVIASATAVATFVVLVAAIILLDLWHVGESTPTRDRERIARALGRMPRANRLLRRLVGESAA